MMPTADLLTLDIDRTQALPLYLQICQRFKTAIAQGHLRAGQRVPAVRALATELNLARGTVEMAYRILTDEGYLQVRGAAGTVVSPALEQAENNSPGQLSSTLSAASTSVPTARISPASKVSGEHERRRPQDLQMGLPALDAFPRKTWTRLTAQRLRNSEALTMAYPDPCGYWPLRERIATYLGLSRGVSCLPQQVFITAGYRTSLELILRSLAAPADAFWFEDPGYLLAQQFLRNIDTKLVPVPVDQDGLIVVEGIRRCPDARFALVTPSHQSPLGVTLTLERRLALLAWAAQNKSWIIEDDYDSEFRYQGRPLPALKSLDRHDRVIYCGTFSKVLFPGLRLSYVVVPESATERFEAVSTSLHAGCPYLFQASVADFMAGGHFARHLKKMRALYTQRRHIFVSALREVLGERMRIALQPGGLHILAQLPNGIDDAALADRAKAAGLAVHALSRWTIQAQVAPGLLMGFANIIDTTQAKMIALKLRQAFDETHAFR